MGWSNGNYDDEWVTLEADSPFMYYLNYILVISCLVVIIFAAIFLIRECCYNHQQPDEDEEMVIMRQEPQPPVYTEATAQREYYRNLRIMHEYDRHQSGAPPTTSSNYFSYNAPPCYYMYPMPNSNMSANQQRATAPACATAQLVQRNYGDVSSPPRDARPPPYAPNH